MSRQYVRDMRKYAGWLGPAASFGYRYPFPVAPELCCPLWHSRPPVRRPSGEVHELPK
jgi:hypothetical protein